MQTPLALLQPDARNPLIRGLVHLVSALNAGEYRLYFVPSYRAYMYLNLSEPLTLRRLAGQYEKQKRLILNRYLKPGMTFVDVGANLGDYTIIASRLVGSRGRVVAFEPDPGNSSWLSKSITKNQLANVEVRHEALSDRDGEANLFLGEVSGWHTLKEGQLPREAGMVSVRTVRLDSLNFERMDLVKVDVEGAEYEVVQGAVEQLKRHRPMLLIDLHPTRGANIKGVISTLRQLEYDVMGLDDRGGFRPYADHICEIAAIPSVAYRRAN